MRKNSPVHSCPLQYSPLLVLASLLTSARRPMRSLLVLAAAAPWTLAYKLGDIEHFLVLFMENKERVDWKALPWISFGNGRAGPPYLNREPAEEPPDSTTGVGKSVFSPKASATMEA